MPDRFPEPSHMPAGISITFLPIGTLYCSTTSMYLSFSHDIIGKTATASPRRNTIPGTGVLSYLSNISALFFMKPILGP